jgi:hypothetical protein
MFKDSSWCVQFMFLQMRAVLHNTSMLSVIALTRDCPTFTKHENIDQLRQILKSKAGSWHDCYSWVFRTVPYISDFFSLFSFLQSLLQVMPIYSWYSWHNSYAWVYRTVPYISNWLAFFLSFNLYFKLCPSSISCIQLIDWRHCRSPTISDAPKCHSAVVITFPHWRLGTSLRLACAAPRFIIIMSALGSFRRDATIQKVRGRMHWSTYNYEELANANSSRSLCRAVHFYPNDLHPYDRNRSFEDPSYGSVNCRWWNFEGLFIA